MSPLPETSVLIFQLRVSLNRNCNLYGEYSGIRTAVYLRCQSKRFVWLTYANTDQCMLCVVQSEKTWSCHRPQSEGLIHQLKLQILLLLVLEFSVLVLELDMGGGP